MEVIPYQPAMAREVAIFYNGLVRDVPHCYPVSAEEFASALAPATAEGRSCDRLHSEAAFVAREARAVQGFVHAAIESPKDTEDPERGAIRFLGYERGHRGAGQALLDAAEEHLRERGVPQIIAFHQDHRYRFYHFEHAYLSDRLGQVHALLAFNGYEPAAGEVFLDWPDYEPVAPLPVGFPVELSVDWRQGRGRRPGLVVLAHRGEERVGVCECRSGGEWSDAADAQDWFLTTWLGVEDALRGRGLGRHLLQRALVEMRGIGYRHAAISTSWRNARAFLFYSNCGYRVVDWTYGLARELAQEPS